jgi:asparagine synthase (glutamine-hydrolysing)
MAARRFCGYCGKDVNCREEPEGNKVALICPDCGRRVATSYGHIVIQSYVACRRRSPARSRPRRCTPASRSHAAQPRHRPKPRDGWARGLAAYSYNHLVMCGIAGAFALNGRLVADGLAERMSAVLAHRGPDDRGCLHAGPASLGHQRLSIIDLSPDARQPLTNEDGTVALICNGEIYNHLELRERLLHARHRFVSRSDSEVLVHLYEDHADQPERMLHELDGMFAFGIHDRRRERLFVARDRLGIKPLYWAIADGLLLFASEPKGILASGLIEAHPNPGAVASYLAFRHAIAPETMFEGIHALEPGHYLIAEHGQVRIERYWDIPAPDRITSVSEAEHRDHLRALLEAAVRKRLMADVPLGAYLSGGLDSSIVVALMAQQTVEPVKTYSIGFGDETDEFPFARLVADRYATDHHEIVIEAPRYFELLPELIRHRDAPLAVPNEVPLYQMSRELKRDITVVLSGEGADELFGGYGDYARIPFDWRKGRLLARLPTPVRRLLHGGIETKYGAHAYEPNPLAHFLAGYGWFRPEEIGTLLTPQALDAAGDGGRDHITRHFARTEGWDDYDRVLYILERVHLVNLLNRVDTMTMATAVEARVPFVDNRLVEYAFSIPASLKLRWRSPLHHARAWLSYSDRFRERDDVTKAILRDTFADLVPQEILRRRKVGFKAPLEGALRPQVLDYARGLLLDRRTRDRGILDVDAVAAWLDRGDANGGEFGLRAWMLLNLELWFRMYIDGDDDIDMERLMAIGARL